MIYLSTKQEDILSANKEVVVTVDSIFQPFIPFGCARIVCCQDVFHNDAFKGTPAYGVGNSGERKYKWYCEDYAGNLVAEINVDSPFAYVNEKIIVFDSTDLPKNVIVKEISLNKENKIWLWQLVLIGE